MGMVQVGCGLSSSNDISNCSCVLSLKICYLDYTSLLASVTPFKLHHNTNSSNGCFYLCYVIFIGTHSAHLVLVLLSSS